MKDFGLGASDQFNKQRHLLCFGHLLNNVWGDCSKELKATSNRAGSVTQLFTIVDIVHKVIFCYAQSSQRRAALHDACILGKIASKCIMFPVSTRWWAELFSISRAFDLGKALCAVTATQMNLTGTKAAEYRSLLLKFQGVLDLLPPIIAIGRVWEKWQTILSAGTSVTLSYYPQAVRDIIESVFILKEYEARNSSDIVADIISDMRASIIKRLADIPLIALAAELLNPLTTHRANNWENGNHEKVSNFLFEWINAVAPPPTTSVAGKWGCALPIEVLEKT